MFKIATIAAAALLSACASIDDIEKWFEGQCHPSASQVAENGCGEENL